MQNAEFPNLGIRGKILAELRDVDGAPCRGRAGRRRPIRFGFSVPHYANLAFNQQVVKTALAARGVRASGEENSKCKMQNAECRMKKGGSTGGHGGGNAKL
jgi:hypothetical protein